MMKSMKRSFALHVAVDCHGLPWSNKLSNHSYAAAHSENILAG